VSSIFQCETWQLKPGVPQETHDEAIRAWFTWVAEHPDLFEGWRGARHFRELDHSTGLPTGRFVMLFEYASEEQRRAYKARRANWDGPYEAYKAVDPYQTVFNLDTVTSVLFEPAAEDLWFEFPADVDRQR
jgi:hypothetical protein